MGSRQYRPGRIRGRTAPRRDDSRWPERTTTKPPRAGRVKHQMKPTSVSTAAISATLCRRSQRQHPRPQFAGGLARSLRAGPGSVNRLIFPPRSSVAIWCMLAVSSRTNRRPRRRASRQRSRRAAPHTVAGRRRPNWTRWQRLPRKRAGWRCGAPDAGVRRSGVRADREDGAAPGAPSHGQPSDRVIEADHPDHHPAARVSDSVWSRACSASRVIVVSSLARRMS